MADIVSEGIQEISKVEMVVVIEGESEVCVEVGLTVLPTEEQPTPNSIIVESVSFWESVWKKKKKKKQV
jgi:hypothetical protein